MPGHLFRRMYNRCRTGKYRGLNLLVPGLFLAAGLLLAVMDYKYSAAPIEDGLRRNSYGEGSRTEQLQAVVEGGGKMSLQVEVTERVYAEGELRSLFDRCIKKLDHLILGENESLDHIDADMNLMTSLPGEPVEITWELSRYDVMNIYGELQDQALIPEGTAVALNAVLTYTQNPEKQALYECAAVVFPRERSPEEKRAARLEHAIQEEDEKGRTKERLQLPDTVDGKTVRYYYEMDRRGIILIIMAAAAGVLMYAMERQNQDKEAQERKKQMLLDYPEVVNKLTLFLGAGMTVKRAWKKIVSDYEEQKDLWGERYIYEEMKKTSYEMESGIMESESYERFGRRCMLQEYVRLGAMLSQNLRKGTKGLNQVLRLEAVQAFEERKARAKRLGEEAGTKLLGPMFLMLAVVLFIVIVPAFMSIQL